MDFKLTDEQLLIQDTAATAMEELSDSAAVRSAMNSEHGYNPDTWRRICQEMCWTAMHIPEQFGGLGLGYVELAITLESMGKNLFCSPFFSSVGLAANALLITANEEQKARWLPAIAEGSIATLAFSGKSSSWDINAVSATFINDSDESGFVLNGDYRYVTDGNSASFAIVAAKAPCTKNGLFISLFIVDLNAEGVTVAPLPTLDQTRRQSAITFNNVHVGEERLLGELGQSSGDLESVLDLGRIALAADQIGGAQKALDISVAYLQERVQFGRVIASYQALKHKCADMMVKVEAGRSALYYAACVADEFLAGRATAAILAEAASIAKGYASDAYFYNAGCGIQLHGGVGFTEEYDIQLYFKRARSTESFLGGPDYHKQRLATMLLDE